MQDSVECAKIHHELEIEKMKQQQWQAALEKIEAKAQAAKEHSKCLEEMERMTTATMGESTTNTLDWLRSQIDKVTSGSGEPSLTEQQEKEKRLQQEREAAIQELKDKQVQITQQLKQLQGEAGDPLGEDPMEIIRKGLNMGGPPAANNQVLLLQQLKTALSGKEEEDPNKILLRALVTQQNKTTGEGGTSTLKPGLLNKVTMDCNTMAEWLANLNKQEEGESEIPTTLSFTRGGRSSGQDNQG